MPISGWAAGLGMREPIALKCSGKGFCQLVKDICFLLVDADQQVEECPLAVNCTEGGFVGHYAGYPLDICSLRLVDADQWVER